MRHLQWNTAIWLALVLPTARAFPADAGNQLAAKIDAVINAPEYRQARWGILVADAKTGQTVYERDGDRLFLPASTTKLYSCAAALAALGADYRFETPVYRRGQVTEGRLKGDLILVAKGDLTLGGRTDAHGRMAFRDHDHIYAGFMSDAQVTDTDPLAGLKELAKQVAAAGIRGVDGDVLIDDRLFAGGRGGGSGPSLITPIMVNDNIVDIVVTPADEAGKPAQVRMRPETQILHMDAQVQTGPEDKGTDIEVKSAAPLRITVRGRIAVKSKPAIRIHIVEDPADFARLLFIDALKGKGVDVAAPTPPSAKSHLPEPSTYDPQARVARYTSPPFSEAIKVILKVSHNLYANTLPLLLAVHHGKHTLADGLGLERQFLAELGVAVETISFADGAGGANADAVTPRATVQMLGALRKRPDYPVFEAGLPVLGVDGTLVGMVPPESPARGKVRAKTGTLVWQDLLNDRPLLKSKALAGTMTTATGRTLLLAMFVNDVPLPKGVSFSREGKVLGKLCEIVYQYAP
jgi:D-alanyl-D-alanine carboxypeptidase/D-alanyl-D-alanine-endopeptidase (penicillin-binding protein 4)